jgi:hypothetical protein
MLSDNSVSLPFEQETKSIAIFSPLFGTFRDKIVSQPSQRQMIASFFMQE